MNLSFLPKNDRLSPISIYFPVFFTRLDAPRPLYKAKKKKKHTRPAHRTTAVRFVVWPVENPPFVHIVPLKFYCVRVALNHWDFREVGIREDSIPQHCFYSVGTRFTYYSRGDACLMCVLHISVYIHCCVSRFN